MPWELATHAAGRDRPRRPDALETLARRSRRRPRPVATGARSRSRRSSCLVHAQPAAARRRLGGHGALARDPRAVRRRPSCSRRLAPLLRWARSRRRSATWRATLRDPLPEPVLNRAKTGFVVPVRDWVAGRERAPARGACAAGRGRSTPRPAASPRSPLRPMAELRGSPISSPIRSSIRRRCCGGSPRSRTSTSPSSSAPISRRAPSRRRFRPDDRVGRAAARGLPARAAAGAIGKRDPERIEPARFWQPLNARPCRARSLPARFDALWIHGYARWNALGGDVSARRRGIKVLLRDEATPISAARGPAKQAAKRVFFAGMKRLVDAFLAIGSLNRRYYVEQRRRSRRASHGALRRRQRALPSRRGGGECDARGVPRRSSASRPGRPILLFAAKLIERKRPRALIEAFARSTPSRRCAQPVLVFAGDGPLRAELERAPRAAPGAVKFLGFQRQSELPRCYDLCDAFVLPSGQEAWGLVVNEVMCAGRAVIAWDRVGSAPDLVRPGENGAIFRPTTSSGCASAMRDVLADRADSPRMGRAASRSSALELRGRRRRPARRRSAPPAPACWRRRHEGHLRLLRRRPASSRRRQHRRRACSPRGCCCPRAAASSPRSCCGPGCSPSSAASACYDALLYRAGAGSCAPRAPVRGDGPARRILSLVLVADRPVRCCRYRHDAHDVDIQHVATVGSYRAYLPSYFASLLPAACSRASSKW